ncbi:hypothetical protein [Exiguobacterium sp.]|uniref:hypothetical protein n=1 Tax=Exiguobacterium sp. TaxID=44751 RepID=UPI00307F87B3
MELIGGDVILFACILIGSIGLTMLALPILETNLSDSLAFFTLGGIGFFIGMIAIFVIRHPSAYARSFIKFVPYFIFLFHFPASLVLLWISSIRHDGVPEFALDYTFVYWMFLLMFVVINRLMYRAHLRQFEKIHD